MAVTTRYHSPEGFNLNMMKMPESKELRDPMDLREVTNRRMKKIAF
jgi:hypothetical protein